MSDQHDAQQLAEAFKLQRQAREWFANLALSGVSAPAAVSAMSTALIEIVIANQGKAGAVRWMKGQIELVDRFGDAMETELKRGA